jgi:hypothetical protein
MRIPVKLKLAIEIPIAKVEIAFQPETDFEVVKWEIVSPQCVKYEVIGEVPDRLIGGIPTKLMLSFAPLDFFREFPVAKFAFVGAIMVDVKIPITFGSWMASRSIDEAKFHELWAESESNFSSTVNLVIPDGDVMEEVIQISNRTFHLAPVKFSIGHTAAFCGAFKGAVSEIEVMLKFMYIEEDLDLSLAIRATSLQAVEVLSRAARQAFLK